MINSDGQPIDNYEYLLHHIETLENGKEVIHHCLVYDHIANMFIQNHLWIKNGKVYLEGKEKKEGYFHVIGGLEPTQVVAWSDEEAEREGVIPKQMHAGMTLKNKAKVW